MARHDVRPVWSAGLARLAQPFAGIALFVALVAAPLTVGAQGLIMFQCDCDGDGLIEELIVTVEDPSVLAGTTVVHCGDEVGFAQLPAASAAEIRRQAASACPECADKLGSVCPDC